jgi:hypothetical protein
MKKGTPFQVRDHRAQKSLQQLNIAAITRR